MGGGTGMGGYGGMGAGSAGTQTTCTATYTGAAGMTAGSAMFPVGSTVQVTNPANGKSVNVRIANRANGCMALSKTAFAMVAAGRATLPNARVRLVNSGN